MKIVKELRANYERAGKVRPNTGDVLKLCDVCELLEALVRDFQHDSPTERQNDVERWLALIDKP